MFILSQIQGLHRSFYPPCEFFGIFNCWQCYETSHTTSVSVAKVRGSVCKLLIVIGHAYMYLLVLFLFTSNSSPGGFSFHFLESPSIYGALVLKFSECTLSFLFNLFEVIFARFSRRIYASSPCHSIIVRLNLTYKSVHKS